MSVEKLGSTEGRSENRVLCSEDVCGGIVFVFCVFTVEVASRSEVISLSFVLCSVICLGGILGIL